MPSDAPTETVRTEGLAARQTLPIAVGSTIVDVRVLSMDESDLWNRYLAEAALGAIGPAGEQDPDDEVGTIAGLLNAPARTALDLVRRYDVDGVITDELAATFTKGQVKAAADAMALAEDPFGQGARRLVEEILELPPTSWARGCTS